MPVIIKCGECGAVLHEDYKLHSEKWNQHSNYMKDILNRLGWKCPGCGHGLKLVEHARQVEVLAYLPMLKVPVVREVHKS